jgi:D-aminopeptidase
MILRRLAYEEFKEGILGEASLLGEEYLDPIYKATVEATGEAMVNALFKAETMVGINGNICHELSIEEVTEIFEKYGRKLIFLA